VFGGEYTSVVRFKDMPIEAVSLPKEDEDKMMHIGLPTGEDDLLMANDTLPALGQELVQGNNAYISNSALEQGEGGQRLQRPSKRLDDDDGQVPCKSSVLWLF
jgi:PhnB protein